MKTCPKHGIEMKPRRGSGYRCRECASEYGREHRKTYYRDTPSRRAYMKNYGLVRAYGVTVGDFNRILAEQGDACAICKATEPGGKGVFHVDHDHRSGVVRGLLCHGCNTGLGSFRDSTVALRGAIGYLAAETFSEGAGI